MNSHASIKANEAKGERERRDCEGERQGIPGVHLSSNLIHKLPPFYFSPVCVSIIGRESQRVGGPNQREGKRRRRAACGRLRYLNQRRSSEFYSRRMQGDVRLLTDTAPARCAEMLARGDVDAALVPVIEYQRLSGIAVVPEVCVGANSRVRSVVLVTRGAELKDVRSVALDTSSRTSAALVQISFASFCMCSPECRPAAPDLNRMLEESDAALMIGDPR